MRTDTVLSRRIAALMESSRSLPNVLDAVVRALADGGYPGAGITLINERDELYIVAYDGPPDEDILALRLPVGHGIMGSVAAQRRPALIDDLDSTNARPANRDVGAQAHMRSMLAVPIISGDTVVGVLEVDSTEPHRFDSGDLALFEQVAELIADAVHEVAPLELAGSLLRRRVEEVLVLEETTRALTRVDDVGAAQDAVVRYTSIGLGCPHALLLRIDHRGAILVAEHRTAAATGRRIDIAAGPELRATLLAGPGFLSREDLDRWLPSTGTVPDHAVAFAPVRAGEEFSGALIAVSRDYRSFDPAELRLLESIADLAGLAISNADRYRRLQLAADTDATTGLLSRPRFERDFAAHNGEALAVLSIDIDRLRVTNDTYGHEAGDAVLEHVGEAFDKLVIGRGPVARTGADEFAVLLPGADAATAASIAEEIRAAMHGLVPPYGMVRISVGVAVSQAGGDARATWSNADQALGRAKECGGDRVEVAAAESVPSPVVSTRWDDRLAQLLARDSIESAYQPLVRFDDDAVIGYEALARPRGEPGDTSVEGLFAAAHRRGLSREFDWLARREAVHGWNAATVSGDVALFINCSVASLVNPVHDADQMLMLLHWAGVAPAAVVLEISEREQVDDFGRLRAVVDEYRSYGFRFSLDDVGDGWTTIRTLATVQPEYIKLAPSLTTTACLPGSAAAIRAIVAFAASCGATVVAEGIETDEQAEQMRAMRVGAAQGWRFGRPARLPAGMHQPGTAAG